MGKRSNNRRVHTAPGIYYKEIEVPYSGKSDGMTSLGLAGETLKGPAFQAIQISDWKEFEAYFGGTSTEKYRGSQYPKYELPYIAKEYLKQSKELQVVRTLGFSGVNAGPAWVITATKYKTEQGFIYTASADVDPVTDFEVDENTYGNTVFFTVPVPFTIDETEDNPSAEEIVVVNAYRNDDTDIIFFDEYCEEFYECLSEGAREDYASIYELMYAVKGLNYTFKSFNEDGSEYYTEGQVSIIGKNGTTTMVEVEENGEPSWVGRKFLVDENHKNGSRYYYLYTTDGTSYELNEQVDNVSVELQEAIYNPVMYINYPTIDVLEGGKVSVIYDGKVVISTEINKGGKDFTEDDKDYALLTYAGFLEKLRENGYDISELTRDDFNINKFSVYHYGYTATPNSGIEDGKGYKYERSVQREIDVEDEHSEFANVVIGIIRSRGQHKNAVATGMVDECGNTVYTRDGIQYFANNVELVPSTTMTLGDNCNPGYNTETGDFNINPSNYGKFTIVVDSVRGCYNNCGQDEHIKSEYSVSLNPMDKNYITKVIGTDPEVGDAEIYVEELYDVALEQLIYAGEINAINHELAHFPYVSIVPEHEPVDDLLTEQNINLNKKHLGKRYLYTYAESLMNGIKVRISKDDGVTWEEESVGMVGHIYTVLSTTDKSTGKKEYFYGEYRDSDGSIVRKGNGRKKYTEYLRFYQYYRDVVKNDFVLNNCVKVASDDMYYVYTDFSGADSANEGDVRPITLDFNNYKDEYRYSSTPWIVSELKGSGETIHLHKLFRFHTISDGDNSIEEVKVSIENIDPDDETFDVIVRSFYDSDTNPAILERFGKCTLIPGDKNYIGRMIGTFNGDYEGKSAYITVEINEDDMTTMSIPCGFLGYPVRNYKGYGLYDFTKESESLSTGIKQPYVKFKSNIDDELSVSKQYFGFSDLIGIDTDILSYKGVEAYSDDPDGLTPSFHLDARILNGEPVYDPDEARWYVEEGENRQYVDVDGVSGYNWVTVNKAETTDYGIEPRIGTEEVMEGTIYEDKRNRKFTVCFYGGWDGWDYYRTNRSNGDEFRASKYKGSINKDSGVGTMFSVMKDPAYYGFDAETKVINSDYYAYMAAYKQFDNPGNVTVNVLATPGIDYVNQTALVHEVIDMVEEERGDALYVVTTPDKPSGAGDSETEMYSPAEAVSNLEDAEIDSNYACTYYPWVKYADSDNNMEIYLPVTCDVVRNIAYTDNKAKSWLPSAGWIRGDVTGIKPRKKLKVKDESLLYDGRINYVKSFSRDGDKIWGDKNLQKHDGIMNRISKRRLLIYIKREVTKAFVGLIFDPNDATMASTFESGLKAVLSRIRSDRGIYDYRIEIDDSPEARDRLELPAILHIKPTQMLEYVDITLAMTPNSVVWS